MVTYSHIRLELARETGQTAGDPTTGYDILAPLDSEGRLDAAAWRTDPARSRVRRFRRGETDAVGELAHVSGGRWIFDFSDDDRADESGFHLERERFQPGEYVSVTMTDGRLHTFQVASVRSAEIA